MTVITKNLGDKKSDNLKDPLVENIVVEPADEGLKGDVEGGYPIPPPQTTRYIISARVRPYYSLMLIIMLFLLVATSILGIFGTEYLYDQYKYIVGSEQKPAVYRAWGPWPYNDEPMAYDNKVPVHIERIQESDQGSSESEEEMTAFEAFRKDFLEMIEKRLSYLTGLYRENVDEDSVKVESQSNDELRPFEEIQLDVDKNRYEKIEVPSKMASRFVHDFQSNYTAIVDVANKRCFIMPLDRTLILPPKSMFDLLYKMSNGYYSMDTEKVRRDMRVVLPPLEDVSSLGIHIQQECEDFASYKLEKYVSGGKYSFRGNAIK
ncbi:hypothetical protein V9T40_004421 [Parthenolecanium corni]|uniref:Integral membrane protein 2 n=1 Tax=Parthenolecanium corni TaxID=536013 RepID=A0AAN9U3E5_9HEMI